MSARRGGSWFAQITCGHVGADHVGWNFLCPSHSLAAMAACRGFRSPSKSSDLSSGRLALPRDISRFRSVSVGLSSVGVLCPGTLPTRLPNGPGVCQGASTDGSDVGPDRLLPSHLDESQSWPEYLATMRSEGVWGDNLTLQALSDVLRRRIRVVGTRSVVISEPIVQGPDPDVILAYDQDVHYDAVIHGGLDAITGGVVDVEDQSKMDVDVGVPVGPRRRLRRKTPVGLGASSPSDLVTDSHLPNNYPLKELRKEFLPQSKSHSEILACSETRRRFYVTMCVLLGRGRWTSARQAAECAELLESP